jgi:hypothetical protein
MSAGRTISLIAWAAIIAAWALPPTVQKSSDFASVPDNGLSHSSVIAAATPWPRGREAASQTIETHAANNPGDPWNNAELVDHLGEPLEPADYWALTNPNLRGLLPPVEYAHPYHGRVLLLRGRSQEAMRRICGKQPPGVLLGCARKPDANGVPFVVLADDATVGANGWTQNLNALHEAGHLNGAWTHDGWRDIAQLGKPVAAPIVVAQADALPREEDEPPPVRRHHPRRYYDESPPPPYAPYPPPPWAYPPAPWPWHPCPIVGPLTAWRICL